MTLETDILIIGAGPVGLFSAFQAGMMDMRSIVIDALDTIGGQCMTLYPEKPIYDIPAYPVITGAELIQKLEYQASRFDPYYILGEQLIELTKNEEGFFSCTTNKGIHISAKAIIIAGGCGSFGPNRPPISGIEEYENKSVFYYVKDKSIFQDKRVVIAGGGDSAVDWAIALSNIAEVTTLVHRRAKFRCLPASTNLLNEAIDSGKVELAVPYQLHSISGAKSVLTHVILSDLDNNLKILDADYLLVFFGLAMELGPILNWGLNIAQHHISVSQHNCATNISGIYAVGDIAHYQGKLKLIMTGFAEAAAAIHDAYKVVNGGKLPHFVHSTDKIMPNL